MNKIASYLQEHVAGEVVDAAAVRRHFSNDSSVLEVAPSLVIYPKHTNDVRKVTRFAWQLAEKGHILPITPRGLGSNQTGAALGKGVVLPFAGHMQHLLEFDAKQRLARIQPGLNFAQLQEVLKTHGVHLPVYPPAPESSTLGGALADNAQGEKSVKYGPIRQYTDSLEVVLANGELIQTGRLTKRELSHKKGRTTFEGEIYRQLDNLIADHWELLQQYAVQPAQAGYAITDIKHKDGSFDLTPLFVGAQGTLGIITEAIIKLEQYSPHTTLLAAYFNDPGAACSIAADLLRLRPSALELVDRRTLELVARINPARFKGLLEAPLPALVLLVEFDDSRGQPHKAKKAQKIIAASSERYSRSDEPAEQDRLWSLRHAVTEAAVAEDGTNKALPLIDGGMVVPENLAQLMTGLNHLLEKHHLEALAWYSFGAGGLQVWPLLDLAKIGDRQRVFKFLDDYYDLLISLQGTAGNQSDGRLRTPYISRLLGPDLHQLTADIKRIFDPHNIFNPDVKVGASRDQLLQLLRKDYSAPYLYNNLPPL